MILARNSITLHHLRDITTVVWYYKLQASTASPPTKPTTETPSGWSTTEPSYTEGSTNSLYVVQKTTFSDGTFEYSDVSLSTSYEAAKAAYNKSVQAKDAADAAQESIDNLEIGGRNLLLDTATERISPASSNNSAYVAPVPMMSDYASGILNNREDFFTYSFDYEVTGNEASEAYIYVQIRGGTVPSASQGYYSYVLEKPTGKHCCTFKLTEAQATGTYADCGIRLRNATNGAILRVWNIKLEKGTKATDWTPAPEDTQADIDALQPELIVGTHGTTATATWTGTSTVLTEIKAGTRIQYKLSSAGASNVTLNLTLKGGTTTGAKPVYFLNTTRLGTQYGVNAIVDLIYDGSAWRVLNPYTNSNTVGTYGGAVKAGANGVKNYSLVMRDTETTWVSLTTTAGTGATKERYTGKLYPDKVMYMGSNSAYASGATTGTCYEALGVNLQYSTNCGSTLTSGRAVYLVGTLDSDGLFTLDATWWTQTIPTTADGKTYIYLGLAYSTTSIYLVPENTLYQYFEGAFRTLREIEEMKAAKVANNYISADNTGLMVANMADGNTYTPSNVPSGVKNTFIDEDSFQVRDGTDVLASFGEESRIGKKDENHLDIDATGIQGANADGANFFNVDMDGAVTDALVSPNTEIVRIISVSAGNAKTATVSLEPFSMSDKNVVLRVRSRVRPTGSQQYTYYFDDFVFVYGTDKSFNALHDAYYISVTYSASADTLTLYGGAFQGTGGFVGDSDVFLVSYYRATYAPAFYFGSRADYNPGKFSATLGESLSASSRDQFACGRYNTEDPDYAFMVGNGSETDGESNAFAVTWDGNQLLGLEETAASGTDAELYSAITALGWESEVLV